MSQSSSFRLVVYFCLVPMMVVVVALFVQSTSSGGRSSLLLFSTSSTTTSSAEETVGLLTVDQQEQQKQNFPTIDPNAETYHMIVLVHGWMGNAMEMNYLKESLIQQASLSSSYQKEGQEETKDQFIIHAATCNEGRTFDGIAKGGKRLAQEIMSLWQHLLENQQQQQYSSSSTGPKTVTLSLVGNSLGGLYTRYALSELPLFFDPNNVNQNNEKLKIVPQWFITTCTPHVGVSQHTYLKLPRPLEAPIAMAMQQTGLDLFRYSSTLAEMTLQPKFWQPLLQFHQRMAYINAYGTDFQVPTPTAAFWEDTDSPHHVIMNALEDDDEDDKIDHIILKLQTPQRLDLLEQQREKKEFMAASLTTTSDLSLHLDRIGWTKVLVDVRPHLWSVPFLASSPSSSKTQQQPKMTTTTNGEEKNVLTARELLSLYDTGRFRTLPLGHTVLVANAKSSFYRYINREGQPIMEHLARSMISKLKQVL